jgi:chemotaxis methyl-accepting protein methylase
MSLAYAQRPPVVSSELLAQLMQRLRTQSGIKLDSTQAVIASKIGERMAALDLATSQDYLSIFDDSISARAEWLALTDLLTIKQTRFFRQPEAIELVASFLENHFLAELDAPAEISFWSAGCSTGQELYSIAMVVDTFIRQRRPLVEWHGIGTDLSFQAIAEGQQGCYNELAVAAIPATYRADYVSATDNGEYKISDELLTRIHLFHSNLLHIHSAPFADFDVIFCQNVLIYFDHPTRFWVINQLAERLRPGGLLILGAGEDFRWSHPSMKRAPCPGVCAYKKLEVQ